jgi:hypothetical protein
MNFEEGIWFCQVVRKDKEMAGRRNSTTKHRNIEQK